VQSATYHGNSLTNGLLSIIALHARMIPKCKGSSWMAQLAGKNIVFFKLALIDEKQDFYIFRTRFPV
jgi:hypothetical protein